MRFIGLEEHFRTPEITAALGRLGPHQRDDSMHVLENAEKKAKLEDLGDERLRQMDLIGLDMMVLSVTTPSTQALPPEEAVRLSQQANDRLAATIKAHPDRYSGFATLPTPDPTAALEELERSVKELGLKGAMIHSRTGDRYLDKEEFRPILGKAAELGVPIYLHPEIAPRAVRALYYDGFSDDLSVGFACGGWGWHADTAVASLRLILSGVFDEFPSLNVILGHWGEMLTFYLDRAASLGRWTPNLKKSVPDYFRHNFYVTGSGIYSTPYLLRAIEVMGADRVMYSTDYPFQFHPLMGRTFLENAPIAYEDKHKIAHQNAETLLKLV